MALEGVGVFLSWTQVTVFRVSPRSEVLHSYTRQRERGQQTETWTTFVRGHLIVVSYCSGTEVTGVRGYRRQRLEALLWPEETRKRAVDY